ncbi:hypothetical protein POVWA2_031490 [Plasmodium ovale wallikeri]|nr:hypothetical protein POVWA2_031490 [Plasmodium ovale wallikeri]
MVSLLTYCTQSIEAQRCIPGMSTTQKKIVQGGCNETVTTEGCYLRVATKTKRGRIRRSLRAPNSCKLLGAFSEFFLNALQNGFYC